MQVYSNLPIAAASPLPPYPPHSLYGSRDFILDDLLHTSPTQDAALLTSEEPNLPSTFYNYSVKRFCASVLESLSSLPPSPCLLCGGSMNYAANVIDNVLCSAPPSSSGCAPAPASSNEAKAWYTTLADPFATLTELSPGHSIHPSNKRQIRNALLRLHPTPLFSPPPSPSPSSPKTLTRPLFVVYVDCSDDDLLETRINKRIGEMVERGLKKEVTVFYDRFVNEVNNGERGAVPNVGLFQAIGFKEFIPYLDGSATFASCLDELRRTTLRYVKYQRKYFRNNMLNLLAR